jgi:hypothetical protein
MIITKCCSSIFEKENVNNLADLFYNVYKDFKYSDSNWFYCGNEIWKIDKENMKLRNSIQSQDKYKRKIKDYYTRKNEVLEKKDREDLPAKEYCDHNALINYNEQRI